MAERKEISARARAVFAKKSLVRLTAAKKAGIHPEYLRRQVKSGRLIRVERGIYSLPGAPVTENHSLALAAQMAPNGVICLLSALRFHNITTQLPRQVWMALKAGSRQPRSGVLGLEFIRMSGRSFSQGVEEHVIEGVRVRVYNPAKTVADCFKFRNKVGLDVALEALKEGRHSRRFTADEIVHYARINRVQKVMMPYMEAIF